MYSNLIESRTRGFSAGPEVRGDPNDPRVRLKRDCVAILAAFRMLGAPNKFMILGNTHLYWYAVQLSVYLQQFSIRIKFITQLRF